MTANLQVMNKALGTRFEWNCAYLDTGWKHGRPPTYTLVITAANGVQAAVAS